MLHQLADFLVRMIGLLLIFSAVMWQINPVKGPFSLGKKKEKKERKSL
jgi:hypothetical protein